MKYKHDYLILLIMVVYALGMILPYHLIGLAILVVLYCICLLIWIPQRSVAVPKLIIVSILLQNTFIGIAIHNLGAEGEKVTLYSQVPTIFIALAGFICIYKENNYMRHQLFFMYLFIILFNFVISSNKSLMTFAYNTRNFIIFYLAYQIGKYTIDDTKKFAIFKKFIIMVSVLAGIVGLIGTLTNDQLYVWMGAAEVADVKAANTSAYLRDGLPGYFYGDFFGKFYWRLASLFLEPVNFSSFLALSVVLQATELKTIKSWITLVFLLQCNILTFGKGGLLIDFTCFAIIIVYHVFTKDLQFGKSTSYKIIKFGIIIGVAVLGLYYGVFYSYNMHFYAIRITMQGLIRRPWGYGIGSVGNVNNITAVNASYFGAETGVLNFWCQLGFEGVLVFTILVFRISKQCFKNYKRNKNLQRFVFSIIPVVLYLVFIFQENIFTTQVITGYMLILGHMSREGLCENTIIRRKPSNETVNVSNIPASVL